MTSSKVGRPSVRRIAVSRFAFYSRSTVHQDGPIRRLSTYHLRGYLASPTRECFDDRLWKSSYPFSTEPTNTPVGLIFTEISNSTTRPCSGLTQWHDHTRSGSIELAHMERHWLQIPDAGGNWILMAGDSQLFRYINQTASTLQTLG